MVPSAHKQQTKQGSLLSLFNIAKYIGKATPVLGSAFSLVSAGNHALKGDLLGAGLDLGSAAANTVAPPVAWGLDAVGLYRDITNSLPKKSDSIAVKSPTDSDKEELMKDASQFQKDLANPSAGTDSDLYKAVSPLISSDSDHSLQGAEAERINNLKEQVRKGLVGLEYATGLKKNQVETFYDKHPAEAVTTEALKHAPAAGLGVAGLGALVNYRRQKKNMDMTEPAQMARSGNPVDVTNPANLLDPSAKDPSRADVSRIFGHLEDNPEKRLALLDRMHKHTAGDSNSFSEKYRALSEAKANAVASHTNDLQLLEEQLKKATNRDEINKATALINAQHQKHSKNLEALDTVRKNLLQEARKSEGSAGLQKYVNLHESLRRAREKGGLKDYLGGGAKGLGGIADLLEKYHITGAHPHYDEALIKEIVGEYAGSHIPASKYPGAIQAILKQTGDTKHQASGLSKAFRRIRGPLLAGGLTAAGGAGLYHLIKSIQEQSHSSEQMKEWKRNLLKSRGDFEAADQIK